MKNKMKLIRLFLFCLIPLIFLISCSSGSIDNKSYYLLPIQPQEKENHYEQNQFIFIDSVQISDFLNQSGIVFQTSETAFTIAKQNLWLEPLSLQIRRFVEELMKKTITNALVSSEKWQTPDWIVNLEISGFHVRYDHTILLKGRWIWMKNSENAWVQSKDFEYVIPQKADGYDAFVQEIAELLKQEIRNFSQNLN